MSYRLAAVCGLWTALVGGWAQAQQCTAVFPGGIQSHSPTGNIHMGYMSRVFGSGPRLTAPTVTHFSEYQDQAGFCDGVRCTATGTYAAQTTVNFLSGTEVPSTFQKSSGAGGNLSNGYMSGTLTRAAGDYGTVTVGQESTIRFSSNAPGSTYRMRTVRTGYLSTLEFEAGSYWIDGDLDLSAQGSKLRRIGSGSAPVVLYVSGNVDAGQITLEGFATGQILLYVVGNASFGNNLVFPGRIHARGSVTFGTNAVITGGVYGTSLVKGNSAIIRYTRTGHEHLFGSLVANGDWYNATFELAPGDYYFNGDFNLAVQTTIRKLSGTTGKVRIFVNGNIDVSYAARFEGFGAGELLLYSTANVNITSQTDMPVFVYAARDVSISFSSNARFKGGITGRNINVGQNTQVEYATPTDLGPLCTDQPSVPVVHHYRLIYDPTALTCGSLSVTVRACADADCSSTPTSASTVTLSPSAGWAGNPLTFTGSTTTTLAVRTPGEVMLGLASASPGASNGLVCSTSGCKVTFLDSGFLVSVPNLIAGRPQSATIAAVRKDDRSQACVPTFANVSRTLGLATRYQNPTTGTRTVTLNGSATTARLAFDAGGVATATVNYEDAGQVALDVSYSGSGTTGDQGLSMTGSGSFVAKPYGLCITPDSATCSVAGVSGNCTVLAAAGDAIPIRVRAVGWQGTTVNGVQTGEALDGEALCAGNVVTPNFQLSNIGLRLSLEAPAAGVVGSSTLPASYDHALGTQTSLNGNGGVSFSEVGVFRIAARTSAEYMGMGHVGGDGTAPGSNAGQDNLSRYIGRIVPAYLDVAPNTPLLRPGCVTDAATQTGFSYQGEPIGFAVDPRLDVIGRNRSGGTTTNYDRGDFWRLASDFAHVPLFGSSDADVHDNARLGGSTGFTVEVSDPQPGDGSREASIRDRTLTYARNRYAPLPSDAAFRPWLALSFPAASLTDRDGVCHKSGDTSASAACQPYVLDDIGFPGADSQLRLGRARVENANGSELAPLGLPVVVESWQGSYFAPSADDSCSVLPQMPVPVLSDYTNNLNAGETTPTVTSAGTFRSIELSAPGEGNEGSVRVTPTVPEVLRYDWNGSGSFQDPSGLATFGIYKGSPPLIFRREIYR
ncbi:DUF6701 domain-containing protein [Stutzerimonas azotifigens]|uniref:DUF6701 domain-containing protein n=1 Tax=Stutzerimonas azotifigens TaxID=291995 RepID=UPI0004877072|nr:DUF6701 domain-containing protein [Stutzerimonas azotifigens]